MSTSWRLICCLLVACFFSYSSTCYAAENFAHYQQVSDALPIPIPSHITPSKGPFVGGTTVTMFGINFVNSAQLRVRLSESVGYFGATQIVIPTFHSSSMITFVTPAFEAVEKCRVLSTCDVYVTVTNDGQAYNAYPGQMTPTQELRFRWDRREPSGTFGLLHNTTFASEGAAEIRVTQLTVDATEILPSSHLSCLFYSPAALGAWVQDLKTSATWFGYDNASRPIVACHSPVVKEGFFSTVPVLVFVTNTGAASREGLVAAMTNLTMYNVSALPFSIDSVTTNQDNPSALLAARGPLRGNTEITIRGNPLVASSTARCILTHVQDTYGDGTLSTFGTCSSNADCPSPNWSCCVTTVGNSQCCAVVDASFVRIFDSAGSLTSQEYRCMSPDHPGIPYATSLPKNGTNLDPGFRCNVQFTYDIGSLISSRNFFHESRFSDWNDAKRFVYTDIYVSPSGSDALGDGTRLSPFRTIQRALDMALYNLRDGQKYENGVLGLRFGQIGVLGSLRMFNPDTIVLRPGVYRGFGNRGLIPYHKLLVLRSEFADTPGRIPSVVVDCENSGDGFMFQGLNRYLDNDPGSRELIQIRDITTRDCTSRRVFSVFNPFTGKYETVRHHLVDFHRRFDRFGDPNFPRQPVQVIDPNPNAFRPGRTVPGQPCGELGPC